GVALCRCISLAKPRLSFRPVTSQSEAAWHLRLYFPLAARTCKAREAYYAIVNEIRAPTTNGHAIPGVSPRVNKRWLQRRGHASGDGFCAACQPIPEAGHHRRNDLRGHHARMNGGETKTKAHRRFWLLPLPARRPAVLACGERHRSKN